MAGVPISSVEDMKILFGKIVLLCFCHVIFTRHLFIADLSLFCTYAVLAGPLGDRFCNPHVVILVN
jgi:hypothetical protein